MKPDTEKILSILASHENDPSNLIAILQDVQAEYNYLSEANLTLIADTLGLSVSKVYSVATFYENFSLEAKGKHIVKVCAGTACHVRKSGPIYDAIYEYLGLHGKKKTSDDGPLHARNGRVSRCLRFGAGHDRGRRGACQDGPRARHRAA